VPSVARIAALVACGVLAGVGATACGTSGGQVSGFCAAIRQPSSAFNSLDAAHAPRALAAFDRIAAQAPVPVAADLRIVSGFQRTLRSDPGSIVKDPSLLTNYGAATKRIDAYLHHTCGVSIPPFGKLF
jgi:hypothetical protein